MWASAPLLSGAQNWTPVQSYPEGLTDSHPRVETGVRASLAWAADGVRRVPDYVRWSFLYNGGRGILHARLAAGSPSCITGAGSKPLI